MPEAGGGVQRVQSLGFRVKGLGLGFKAQYVYATDVRDVQCFRSPVLGVGSILGSPIYGNCRIEGMGKNMKATTANLV